MGFSAFGVTRLSDTETPPSPPKPERPYEIENEVGIPQVGSDGSAQWAQLNGVWVNPMGFGSTQWGLGQLNGVWVNPMGFGSTQWGLGQPNGVWVHSMGYDSTQWGWWLNPTPAAPPQGSPAIVWVLSVPPHSTSASFSTPLPG